MDMADLQGSMQFHSDNLDGKFDEIRSAGQNTAIVNKDGLKN